MLGPRSALAPTFAFLIGACAAASPTPSGSSSSVEAEPPLASEAQPPTGPSVALHLSFDDAPGPNLSDVTEANERNARILAILVEHGVEASVFFNCDKLRPGDTTIEAWEAAGMRVGNHTHSHMRLAEVGVDAWLADVDTCDAILDERLDQELRWFRYPYLCEGKDAAERDAALAGLAERGYANAHVTVATSDWLLAGAYLGAKRAGDAEAQDEIADAYLEHMLESVEVAREMARAQTGGETAQVVLFHVNDLAADHLDALLDAYEARGYRFVGLDAALADPVFEATNHYAGPAGLSWLARIHDPSTERQPYWFGLEEGRLDERFGHWLRPQQPKDQP